MAENPYAQYVPQQPSPGENPYAQYVAPQPPTEEKKQFGLGDTWPARLVKSIYSGLTLPGDVYQGTARLPSSGSVPGSTEFGAPDSAGERVADLATITTPVPAALRAGETAIPMARAMWPFIRARPAASPTEAQLAESATGHYQSPSVSDLVLRANELPRISRTVGAEVEKDIHPTSAPKTFSVLQSVEKIPAPIPTGEVRTILSGPGYHIAEDVTRPPVVTGKDLDAFRRKLGNAGQAPDATERLAAGNAISSLDEQLAKNIDPNAVISGDPAAAMAELEKARGDYAALMRSRQITGADYKSELEAGRANSGMNFANRERSNISQILLNRKKRQGYSADEIAAMEKFVKGGFSENATRALENVLGGGGGVGALVAGSVLKPVAPAIGWGLKVLSNHIAANKVAAIDELVRARSPLGEEVGAAMGRWAQAAGDLAAQPSYQNYSGAANASWSLAQVARQAGIEINPRELLRSIRTLQGPAGAGAQNEQPETPRVSD